MPGGFPVDFSGDVGPVSKILINILSYVGMACNFQFIFLRYANMVNTVTETGMALALISFLWRCLDGTEKHF